MGELHEICAMSLRQRFSKKSSHYRYLLILVIASTESIGSGSPKNHYFSKKEYN